MRPTWEQFRRKGNSLDCDVLAISRGKADGKTQLYIGDGLTIEEARNLMQEVVRSIDSKGTARYSLIEETSN